MDPSTVLVGTATASYAASCALGAAVATRRLDTSGARWVHHALYASTLLWTVAAVVAGARRRGGPARALAPALAPLAVIPYAGTRGWTHPVVGLSAAPAYLAAVVLTARGRG